MKIKNLHMVKCLLGLFKWLIYFFSYTLCICSKNIKMTNFSELVKSQIMETENFILLGSIGKRKLAIILPLKLPCINLILLPANTSAVYGLSLPLAACSGCQCYTKPVTLKNIICLVRC